jgi:hypothetical protein
MQHCPQTGKIYVLIIICLVFTSLLISINVFSKSTDDNIFGTGIAISIIQNILTFYLIYIDIFGECSSKKGPGCSNGCKWYNIAPNFNKCTKINAVSGYVYIPIILLSSAYMLSFGIINILGSSDNNDEQDITTLAIASFITGVVGILYIFSDIVCTIGC